MKSLTVYVILFFLGLNIIASKIDLLKYNQIQTFSDEEEISSQLKNFEKKVEDSKYVKKLRNKGINLEDLKIILQNYSDIKSLKKRPKKIDTFRFREKIKNKSSNTRYYNESYLNNSTSFTNSSNYNKSFRKKSLFENRLSKEEQEIQRINTRVKLAPRNIVVLNSTKFLREPLTFFNYNLNKFNTGNVLNQGNCNQDWDYTLNGNDWMCTCQCGKNQSPIDILTDDTIKINNQKIVSNSSSLVFLKENIYFDFKDSSFRCSEHDEEPCKYPVIKNTGNELIIKDECGVVVLPSHYNGYKCFKIELHTPAEHKIDSKNFDLEVQIYFRLENKHVMTGNTTDYLVLSVFFIGVEEDKIPQGYSGVKNHPFLETMELNKIPKLKGQARMMSSFFNFHDLFDPSKQNLIKNNSSNKNISFLENRMSLTTKIMKALNELAYDKHHPLNEYFIYNGSLNKPPCDENVKYIIVKNPLFAPMDQIIVRINIINLTNPINNFKIFLIIFLEHF
jgi:carbonic anhydrase